MNINIDVQYLCVNQEYIRGIPYYTASVLESLINRKNNVYTVSFCDKDKERDNRKYIERSLGKYIDPQNVFENNELDYRRVLDGIRTNNNSLYNNKSYCEYYGIDTDILHFPTSLSIPQNIDQPTVVTVHDMIPVLPPLKHGLNANNLEVFKSSHKFIKKSRILCICDSKSTKNDLKNCFDIEEERLFVVPLGVSLDKFWPEPDRLALLSLNIYKPFLLFLGALDPRKGVDDIVTAFESLRKNYDIQLVLAGTGEEWAKKTLYPLIEKSQYRSDIILTGYVSEEQKRCLLSTAEIFLFPSEYEGFGIPILEAMACGTPVITGNTSSMPEVGGEAALYVTPHEPDDLIKSIKDLLDDKEKRESLKNSGLKWCKKFTWDKTASMTEEVYRIAYERG